MSTYQSQGLSLETCWWDLVGWTLFVGPQGLFYKNNQLLSLEELCIGIRHETWARTKEISLKIVEQTP